MVSSRLRSLFADPEGTPALIRRLLLEYAAGRWKRYGLAFALMAVTAACTAIVAYLVKYFVNETNLKENFPLVVALGHGTMALYLIKGASTYGHMRVLARNNSASASSRAGLCSSITPPRPARARRLVE